MVNEHIRRVDNKHIGRTTKGISHRRKSCIKPNSALQHKKPLA